MAWDEDKKKRAIELYQEQEPTPENSSEVVKDVAEQLEESPNGVRMVLIQAGVYVKKDAAASSSAKKAEGDKPKRVSKEDSINALKDAIRAAGKDVDDEVIDKLTGKAAVYFTSLFA